MKPKRQVIKPITQVKMFNKKISPEIPEYYLLETYFLLGGLNSESKEVNFRNRRNYLKIFYLGGDRKIYKKIFTRDSIRDVFTTIKIENYSVENSKKIMFMIKLTNKLNKEALLKRILTKYPNVFKNKLGIDNRFNFKDLILIESKLVGADDYCNYKFELSDKFHPQGFIQSEVDPLTTYRTFYGENPYLKYPY